MKFLRRASLDTDIAGTPRSAKNGGRFFHSKGPAEMVDTSSMEPPIPLQRIPTAIEYESDDSLEAISMKRSMSRYQVSRKDDIDMDDQSCDRYNSLGQVNGMITNWGDDDSTILPQWRSMDEDELKAYESEAEKQLEDDRDWYPEQHETAGAWNARTPTNLKTPKEPEGNMERLHQMQQTSTPAAIAAVVVDESRNPSTSLNSGVKEQQEAGVVPAEEPRDPPNETPAQRAATPTPIPSSTATLKSTRPVSPTRAAMARMGTGMAGMIAAIGGKQVISSSRGTATTNTKIESPITDSEGAAPDRSQNGVVAAASATAEGIETPAAPATKADPTAAKTSSPRVSNATDPSTTPGRNGGIWKKKSVSATTNAKKNNNDRKFPQKSQRKGERKQGRRSSEVQAKIENEEEVPTPRSRFSGFFGAKGDKGDKESRSDQPPAVQKKKKRETKKQKAKRMEQEVAAAAAATAAVLAAADSTSIFTPDEDDYPIDSDIDDAEQKKQNSKKRQTVIAVMGKGAQAKLSKAQQQAPSPPPPPPPPPPPKAAPAVGTVTSMDKVDQIMAGEDDFLDHDEEDVDEEKMDDEEAMQQAMIMKESLFDISTLDNTDPMNPAPWTKSREMSTYLRTKGCNALADCVGGIEKLADVGLCGPEDELNADADYYARIERFHGDQLAKCEYLFSDEGIASLRNFAGTGANNGSDRDDPAGVASPLEGGGSSKPALLTKGSMALDIEGAGEDDDLFVNGDDDADRAAAKRRRDRAQRGIPIKSIEFPTNPQMSSNNSDSVLDVGGVESVAGTQSGGTLSKMLADNSGGAPATTGKQGTKKKKKGNKKKGTMNKAAKSKHDNTVRDLTIDASPVNASSQALPVPNGRINIPPHKQHKTNVLFKKLKKT